MMHSWSLQLNFVLFHCHHINLFDEIEINIYIDAQYLCLMIHTIIKWLLTNLIWNMTHEKSNWRDRLLKYTDEFNEWTYKCNFRAKENIRKLTRKFNNLPRPLKVGLPHRKLIPKRLTYVEKKFSERCTRLREDECGPS